MTRRNPYTGDRKTRVQAVDIAGRVPPNNEHAEEVVLSAILLDGKCFDDVAAVLPNGGAFYGDNRRRIFDAAVALHAKGCPVDVATIANELRAQDRLQAVGGVSYLTKIVDATPSVANVVSHAKIVRELARVRKFIEQAQMIAAEGYEVIGESQDWFNKGVEALTDVAGDVLDRREVSLLFDIVKTEIETFDGRPPGGIRTGLVDVDLKIGGMSDGELIIVAGRPGMGKTSFALAAADNIASEPQNHVQLGVVVFALEMPKEQNGMRMLAARARVDLGRYKSKQLNPGEFDRLVEAAKHLGNLPVWIDDTPALGLAEMRAKVRERQRAFDLRKPDGTLLRRVGLVIVDHIGLARHSADSREQEVSEISRGLKAMAKELRVPVMALAQLNRAVETRGGKDKRPMLSDLRDSGAIEQDADVVIFNYRPEYYKKQAGEPVPRELEGYAEAIIAKQRNGPTGRVPVTFLDSYTRFENRARDAWVDGDADD